MYVPVGPVSPEACAIGDTAPDGSIRQERFVKFTCYRHTPPTRIQRSMAYRMEGISVHPLRHAASQRLSSAPTVASEFQAAGSFCCIMFFKPFLTSCADPPNFIGRRRNTNGSFHYGLPSKKSDCHAAGAFALTPPSSKGSSADPTPESRSIDSTPECSSLGRRVHFRRNC